MVVAMTGAFGGRMKEPAKAMDELQEMFVPGSKKNKEEKQKSDVARIRAANQFDWGGVLRMSAKQAEEVETRQTMRSDPLLAHYSR